MSKRIVKRIGIIAVLLFYLATFPVYADSGWSGSYDSGGSSSWDSSSSSWDSSSSSSSSDSLSIDDASLGTILMVLLFFVCFIFISILADKVMAKSIKKVIVRSMLSESENSIVNDSAPKENSDGDKKENMEEKIKKILPNFKEEQLKQDVFTIYKKIQVAWMDFDYDTLRKYCTDELYNMYYQQLEVLKQKKQKNVMKNFSQKDFYIVDFSYNEKEIAIKVRTIIKCYDYVVSENNQVVRGSDRMMRLYDYEMTFTQGIKQGTNNKCPNCGASLENNNSSVCSYCHSNITNSDNYDLVLAKKEVISEHNI